jgi:NADH-quinone oxidoreductase subunit I
MPTVYSSPVRRYFANIVKGVSTTVAALTTATRHFPGSTYTIQYPREKAELPDRTRHRLHVMIEDCIGCLQCERACPVDCITIETIKAPKEADLGQASTGNPINFWLPSFTIDMAKCCYCGLCTDPCPTECIVMTPNYEYSTGEITDHVYQFSQMTDEQISEARRIAEEEERRKAEEKRRKAAAKAEATRKASEAPAAGSAEAGEQAPPPEKTEGEA